MRFILRSTVCAAVSFLTVIPGVSAATNELSGPPPAPIIRSWGTEAGLPQNTVTGVWSDQDTTLEITAPILTNGSKSRFENANRRIGEQCRRKKKRIKPLI